MLGFGWATVAVGITYVAGMRHLHRNRPEPPFRRPAEVAAARPTRREYRRAVIGFAVASVVILAVAPSLARSTAELADQLGMSHGFAGLLLLAVTTSLPEAVVTAESVRTESYDLAIGNLFGSNCFNMAALVLLDLANGSASLLAGVDRSLVLGGLTGVVLTTLAMLGVLDRAARSRRGIELAPLVMIAVYVAGLVIAERVRW